MTEPRFNLPPTEQLDTEQVAAILEALGLPQDGSDLEEIIRLVPTVRPIRNSYFRGWNVERYLVRSHSWGRRFDQSYLSCQCMAFGSSGCAHIAAMMIAEAWNDPTHRPLFEQRPWEMRLGALMRRAREIGEEPTAPRRHRGWIRYHLLEPREELVPMLRVHREIVRISKSGDRELKPIRCPRTLSEIESKLSSLTDLDRAWHELNEQIEAMLQPYERHWRQVPQSTIRVLRRLDRERFSLLAQVSDLRYKTAPIEAIDAPFTPRIRARDSGGRIQLDWDPGIGAVWEAGYVLVGEERLFPLPETLDPSARALLGSELPSVAPGDAGRFVERFALRSHVRVSLESEHLPPIREADQIEGQLRLREEDDDLVIAARFCYRVGSGESLASPDDPSALLTVPVTGGGPGRVAIDPSPGGGGGYAALIRRDQRQELARLSGLRPRLELDDAGVARLRGEAALDFLAEALPELRERWTIFGEAELMKYRYRGSASPRVSVPSGVDWFDMKVEFDVGGESIPSPQVLKSWLKGERYHRLTDGSLALLPVSWLERHGAASAELEDLRRASRGKLEAHALPVVSELLPYATGDLTRWKEAAERFDAIESLPRELPPPRGLRAELRPYQLQGFRWLVLMRELGLGGVLADDMGLGKTIQTLALLLDTHRSEGPPSLVVAPTSVIHNWAVEARRFTPDLRVKVFHGPRRRVADVADADVIVTSYALLRLERELFGKRAWRYLILDEAQAIKNPASKLARAARSTRAAHRLALTGTPLENHLLELWSVFEFLMPGFFGARAAFTRRYARPIQKDGDDEAARRLRVRLRPFVLRRLKSEVAADLPQLQEQLLICEFGPAQRRLYERVKGTYRESVLGKVDADGIGKSHLHVLEALTRLRQVCCAPSLVPFDEARGVPSAKMELLFETLEQIIDGGHRSLIFSQWPGLLKKIRAEIDARGWGHLYLDGSTTRRAGLVERWNDPAGPPLFLISLKAGGTGLNLVGADHVIHVDPWWNPAVERQATDRAHRIGQLRPVIAYKLVVKDSVEEKILELQARKRALFEAAVDEGRLAPDELTREDLESVFAPEDPLTPDEEEAAELARLAARSSIEGRSPA